MRARGRGVLLRRKRVGVVAFVRRRVLARRLGLAARECGEKLVPLHGRRAAAATRTRARRRRIRSRRRSRSRRRTLTSPASDAREAPPSGGGGAGKRVSWFEREKRRESGRRRNSASDRAPRLRRRPSSARRPRKLKKENLSIYTAIANGDLGRAVKDALRVCKWKTRVAFLTILLLGFVFQTRRPRVRGRVSDRRVGFQPRSRHFCTRLRSSARQRPHAGARAAPRGSDRDAGQVFGRAPCLLERRGGRRDRSESFSEEERRGARG